MSQVPKKREASEYYVDLNTNLPVVRLRVMTKHLIQAWVDRAARAYEFIDSEIERVALISSAVQQKVHLNSLLMRNGRMGMMHVMESR